MNPSPRFQPPSLAGVLPRPRLFQLLDKAFERPIVWMTAPTGSGKSSLFASYFESRGWPYLWYNTDGGEVVPGVFSANLREGVAGFGQGIELPRVGDPLSVNPKLLARSLFSALNEQLRKSHPEHAGKPVVVVIDKHEEVGQNAPIHNALAAGLEQIGDGVRIVLLSQKPPAQALVRLQALRQMNVIAPEAILFTEDETRDFLRSRMPDISDHDVAALHHVSHGWIGGLTLLADSGNSQMPLHERLQQIFAYIESDVFRTMPDELKTLLYECVSLPELRVAWVEELTTCRTSLEQLRQLDEHFFFIRHSERDPDLYELFPLCREFILQMRTRHWRADKVRAQLIATANLMEHVGEYGAAAQLFMEAGDAAKLKWLVLGHAEEFAKSRGLRQLSEWLKGVPVEEDEDPWLSYWRGKCCFPRELEGARRFFAAAHEGFKACDEIRGSYLSWSGLVDSYSYSLEAWDPLEDCIEGFEQMWRRWARFPDQQTELIATSRMVIALSLRRIDQPHQVSMWHERMQELLAITPSFEVVMDTLISSCIYFLWTGAYERNAVMLERVQRIMEQHSGEGFNAIRMHLMIAIHAWVTADFATARNSIRAGLELSEKHAINIFTSLFRMLQVATCLAEGKMDEAEKLLSEEAQHVLGRAYSLDSYYHYVNAAWFEMLQGNPARALSHMQRSAFGAKSMGNPYYRSLWRIGMAQIQYLLGNAKDAWELMDAAMAIARSMKSEVLEGYALMVMAWFHMEEGRRQDAISALHKALPLSRRHGYVHLEFFLPKYMNRLLVVALDEGIESEYLCSVIARRGIEAPEFEQPMAWGYARTTAWPFAVKIRTLGIFSIEIDGKRLTFTGKEQKKPLELLKALIALGGREVSEEAVTDMLWPSVDGDLAHKSCETTLSRLRKLLGHDSALIYKGGRISFNPRTCWVDSLEVGRLLDGYTGSKSCRDGLCGKVLALYRGNFFERETALYCAVAPREVLKSRVLAMLAKVAASYSDEGRDDEAVIYLQQGINIDALAEEFHRKLMICHKHLGNHADVARIYLNCSAVLKSEFGIEPSPETTAVYRSILPKES